MFIYYLFWFGFYWAFSVAFCSGYSGYLKYYELLTAPVAFPFILGRLAKKMLDD